MAIIETKITARSSIDVPFFNNSATPAVLAMRQFLDSSTELGVLTRVKEESDDGLVQVTITTMESIDVFAQYENMLSIEHYAELQTYNELYNAVPVGSDLFNTLIALAHNITSLKNLTGITSPFTCTTTYSYSDNTIELYPLFESFIEVIESSNNLISFTNSGSQLIAIHQYSDSTDFMQNQWADSYVARSLFNAGVTRTVTCSLV